MNLNPDALFCSLSDSSCTFELQTVRQTFPLLIIHSFLRYSLCSAALTLIFLCLSKKKVLKTKCNLSFFYAPKVCREIAATPDSSNVWNVWDSEARVGVILWKINQTTNLPIACNIFARHVTFVYECCANFHKSKLRVQTTQAELK